MCRPKHGLSAQERSILDALVAVEKPSVTVDDLIDLQAISRRAGNQILSRLFKKGWLKRVKRGVYSVVPLGSSTADPPVEDPWPLAMDLFAPCYISGWSAAEYWDLTEQIFNAVSIVTTRKQPLNERQLGGVRFRTRTIPSERMFGTRTIWSKSHRIEIADPHRILIDILDDTSLGGGGRHTIDIVRNYWRSDHKNGETLLDYVRRYGRGTIAKRLGFLSERYGNVSDEWLAECGNLLSAGVSKLDPTGPDKGAIVSRWNLRVNLPLESGDE